MAVQPNVPVSRTLTAAETHHYLLPAMMPGQYARIDVRQKGIDVAVAISGAGAEEAEIDVYATVEEGPETVSLVASEAGAASVRIRAVHKSAKPGEYEIVLSQFGIADERERTLFEAQREFAAALALGAAGKTDVVRRSIAHSERALALWRSVDDRKWIAIGYLDLAARHLSVREGEQALRLYQTVLPLLRELGWERNVGLTHQSMGWIYEGFGEYQQALDSYERANEILSVKEPHPTVLASIGMAYASLGDTRKAIDHLERSLEISRSLRNRRGEGIALHDLGHVYARTGDHERALPYLEQALEVHRQTSNRRREPQTLAAIARIHALRGEVEKAAPMLEAALTSARGSGDRKLEGVVLDDLGDLYLRRSQLAEALQMFTAALETQRAIADRRNMAVSLHGIARAHLAAGRLEEALQAITEAVELVESMRRGVEPRDLRVSFRAATSDYYETEIEILMRLHEQQPDGGWAVKALEQSERARARSLVEALHDVRGDIREGVRPELVTRLREVRARLGDKEYARTHMLAGGAPAEEVERANREIRELIAELYEAEAELRRSSPMYAALVAPQPLTAAALQREVLDAETVLLEFAAGDRRSFLFAVTRDRVDVHVLPGRSAIDALVRRAHERIADRSRSDAGESASARAARISASDDELRAILAGLHDLLIEPARASLKDRRLLIVPDGPLHFVPFAALVGADGTPLVASHEIAVVPSATVLSVLRRESRETPEGVVAVIADPVFRRDDPRLRRRGTEVATLARQPLTRGAERFAPLPRLRFSRREAEVVDALVREGEKMIALDFDAQRNLLDRIGDYRIIHFATHAIADDDAPELSALVLSMVDRNGVPADGHIRLHDIFNLDLRSELVVLSACETATGREMRGEGLISLTHGFMYAGAPRVMATLWRVDDRATAELMRHFYTAMLREDLSPAAALRRAQLALSRDKRWSAPYYWAGFVLQGEPR